MTCIFVSPFLVIELQQESRRQAKTALGTKTKEISAFPSIFSAFIIPVSIEPYFLPTIFDLQRRSSEQIAQQ